MAKISVIIPVYNRERLLQPCLESLQKQTFRDFELILVDDCSTDQSRSVLQDFLDQNPTIQGNIYATPVNSGVSAARNVGIKNATGDYIFFIDSDDSLSEDCFESLYTKAEKEDLDVVIGENLIIGDTTKYMHVDINDEVIKGNSEVLRLFTTGKWYNVVWNKLVRRSIVYENQLFFKEGYIFEDELWSFCLATKANSLGIVHQATYYYKVGHVSIMTSNQRIKRWSRLLDILPHMKSYIEKEHLLTNLDVSFFYFEKLAWLLSGFSGEKALTYAIFKKVKALALGQLRSLFDAGYITRKHYIGWMFFSLPTPLAYVYYKFIHIMVG